MTDGKLYFAYGSNINLDQMAHRCPAAEVVGPVVLENYRLLFRGNYRGNGVATIAPRKGSKVHGLLWKITLECEKTLDAYEAFPHLYDKQPVTVQDRSGQEFPVMAYIMTERCKEPAVPSNFYYNGILEGYRQNGLPTATLKRAWEHSVKEVHAWTTWLNQQANLSGKKKGGPVMNDKPIKVLVVEPMQPCRVQEICGLTDMQNIVGGTIEAVYPFQHDKVVLVCHGEGKLLGLPYNRTLLDGKGKPYVMNCGTFFIAGLGAEEFTSLTEEQIQRYKAFYDKRMVLTVERSTPQRKTAEQKKKRSPGHER